MKRVVHLRGALKALHPDPIVVDTDTVADAVKAISLQIPGFKPNAITGRRCIQVAECPRLDQLLEIGGPEELNIMPAFFGGKQGGFIQIAIGAVLIAASFFPTPFSSILLNLGIALVLGGILQLIAAPQRDRSTDAKSRYLGTPRNTVEIGTRIPVLYGETKVGGHYLSFNISAVDGAVGNTPNERLGWT